MQLRGNLAQVNSLCQAGDTNRRPGTGKLGMFEVKWPIFCSEACADGSVRCQALGNSRMKGTEPVEQIRETDLRRLEIHIRSDSRRPNHLARAANLRMRSLDHHA